MDVHALSTNILGLARHLTQDLYDKSDQADALMEALAERVNPSSNGDESTVRVSEIYPSMRPWLGERGRSLGYIDDIPLTATLFEETVDVDVYKMATLDDNAVSFHSSRIAQTIVKSFINGRPEAAWALLRLNGVCFDGQNFFDNDHPYLDKESGATWSNILVAARSTDATPTAAEVQTELTQAKMLLSKNKLRNLTIQIVGTQPKLLVNVKHDADHEAYEEVLSQPLINNTTNPWYGKFTLTRDYSPESGDEHKVDFFLNEPGGMRPLFWAENDAMKPVYTWGEPKANKLIHYGSDARYSWGLGIPNGSVRRQQS